MSDVGQRGGEPPRPKQKVFISYAYRDRDLIGRIARDLEAAGFSPWHGEMLSPEQPFQATIERELDEADCVLVLWSRAAAQSQYVRTEIERAAEAWASQRLVLAVLDDEPLPIGLRDLEPVDLRAGLDQSQERLIEGVRRVARPAAGYAPAVVVPSPAAAAPDISPILSTLLTSILSPQPATGAGLRSQKTGYYSYLIPALAFLAGVGVDATVDLKQVFAQAANRLGSPDSAIWIALASAAAGLLAGVLMVAGLRKRPTSTVAGTSYYSPPPPLIPSLTKSVFISYSLKDALPVDALVNVIQGAGHGVWIDRTKEGGERYAEPIVTAIKQAKVIALMASQNAFGSDHVVREIYVAGKWRKPFVVFELDASGLPEWSDYFLSGFPQIPLRSFRDQGQLKAEIVRVFSGGLPPP